MLPMINCAPQGFHAEGCKGIFVVRYGVTYGLGPRGMQGSGGLGFGRVEGEWWHVCVPPVLGYQTPY